MIQSDTLFFHLIVLSLDLRGLLQCLVLHKPPTTCRECKKLKRFLQLQLLHRYITAASRLSLQHTSKESPKKKKKLQIHEASINRWVPVELPFLLPITRHFFQ